MIEQFLLLFFIHHRKIPIGVTDNTWHHVCVLWEIREEKVEVFKDGQRKYVSIGFHSSPQRVGIEATVEKITSSFKKIILLTS